MFSVVIVKSIIWCFSCDFDDSINWCFSRGSLVKETAATSGKVSHRVVSRRTHGAFHQ